MTLWHLFHLTYLSKQNQTDLGELQLIIIILTTRLFELQLLFYMWFCCFTKASPPGVQYWWGKFFSLYQWKSPERGWLQLERPTMNHHFLVQVLITTRLYGLKTYLFRVRPRTKESSLILHQWPHGELPEISSDWKRKTILLDFQLFLHNTQATPTLEFCCCMPIKQLQTVHIYHQRVLKIRSPDRFDWFLSKGSHKFEVNELILLGH